MSVCVCMHVYVGVRIAEKVPVVQHQCCFSFSMKLLPSNRDLVSTGEAAYTDVTSMEILVMCHKSKCQLSMSSIVGENPGGNLVPAFFMCETLHSLWGLLALLQ